MYNFSSLEYFSVVYYMLCHTTISLECKAWLYNFFNHMTGIMNDLPCKRCDWNGQGCNKVWYMKYQKTYLEFLSTWICDWSLIIMIQTRIVSIGWQPFILLHTRAISIAVARLDWNHVFNQPRSLIPNISEPLATQEENRMDCHWGTFPQGSR